MWTDPGNIIITHRHMNVEIGTEAAQFPEKKYINGIFVAVHVAITCGWLSWVSTRKKAGLGAAADRAKLTSRRQRHNHI